MTAGRRANLVGRAAQSLGGILSTLLLSSFLVYLLTALVPGDPALALFRARYGEQAAPVAEQLEAVRREAGFDRPVVVQWARWLAHASRGDLGTSFTRHRPVLPLLARRLPVTVGLTLGSLALAATLGVPLGLWVAGRPGVARMTLALTQVGISAPDYFVGLLLALVFGVRLALLPVAGWGSAAAFVLPALTMALRPWASFTRLTAAGVDEAMRAEWIRTGRAKGLDASTLLWRHALPRALTPVVTLLGANASGSVAASLVAEVIFAIPGSGRMLYEAIAERDIPTIQACLLAQVSLALLFNLLADRALGQLNPQVGARRR